MLTLTVGLRLISWLIIKKLAGLAAGINIASLQMVSSSLGKKQLPQPLKESFDGRSC
jgi:hypothetical protein